MTSRRDVLKYAAALPLASALSVRAFAQSSTSLTNPAMAPVLTRSNDNARSGSNYNETVLNVANVRQRGVAKKFSLPLPGDKRGSECQTLIVPNVQMSDGMAHDLAVIATFSGAVFTYDANTGDLLMVRKYCVPLNQDANLDMFRINDHWGILGTPAIDLDTKTLYFVTFSTTDGTEQTLRFLAHAVDVSSGDERWPAVDLSNASYDPGHGLQRLILGHALRKQRCGILLMNIKDSSGVAHKVVVVTFAAGEEAGGVASGSWRGWVVALEPDPLRITTAWANSARYAGGGIWMSDQAPAADDNGNIYLVAGNGAFDGVTDFGECFTKLHYTPGNPARLEIVDWWSPFTDVGRAGGDPAGAYIMAAGVAGRDVEGTQEMKARPSNATLIPPGPEPLISQPGENMTTEPSRLQYMQWSDQDIGASGAQLIPELGLMMSATKEGILYVFDANNMGKTRLQDFATKEGRTANYKKPKSINWFTYFPGYNVSPTPDDVTKLNFKFNGVNHQQMSTPVYFKSARNGNMLFTCGQNSPVRVWSIDQTGQIKFLAYSEEFASPVSPGAPGGLMSLSANGQRDGTALLYVLFPFGNANAHVSQGFMVVYDAETFQQRPDGSQKLVPLWNSADWGVQFTLCKFNVPTISGGKIYVPTFDARVDVYGLT